VVSEALRQLRSADGSAHCVVLTQVNPRLYATYGYGGSGVEGTQTQCSKFVWSGNKASQNPGEIVGAGVNRVDLT
jgi:hypothetical protein